MWNLPREYHTLQRLAGGGGGGGGLQVINSKVQTKPITLVLEPLIAHSRCFFTIGNLGWYDPALANTPPLFLPFEATQLDEPQFTNRSHFCNP